MITIIRLLLMITIIRLLLMITSLTYRRDEKQKSLPLLSNDIFLLLWFLKSKKHYLNAEVLTLFNSSFDEPESTKPLRAPISQGKKKSSSKELNLVHCQYDLIKIKNKNVVSHFQTWKKEE